MEGLELQGLVALSTSDEHVLKAVSETLGCLVSRARYLNELSDSDDFDLSRKQKFNNDADWSVVKQKWSIWVKTAFGIVVVVKLVFKLDKANFISYHSSKLNDQVRWSLAVSW